MSGAYIVSVITRAERKGDGNGVYAEVCFPLWEPVVFTYVHMSYRSSWDIFIRTYVCGTLCQRRRVDRSPVEKVHVQPLTVAGGRRVGERAFLIPLPVEAAGMDVGLPQLLARRQFQHVKPPVVRADVDAPARNRRRRFHPRARGESPNRFARRRVQAMDEFVAPAQHHFALGHCRRRIERELALLVLIEPDLPPRP